ncbi:MAG: ABC transporter permease [Acidobacteriota bacterium]
MTTLLQDLRYGVRMLRKRPGFMLVVILTLAIGIGLNTAIFSVVNAVLLRPLPFRQPEQLVRVYSEFPTMNLRKFWLSAPEFIDLQNEAKSWESLGAWATGGANVGAAGEPMRVSATRVTPSLIETLGVQPMLGRNFSKEEAAVGGPRAVMLSHGLWQRAFGGAPDIIGKEVRINEQPNVVVGVMPQGYVFPPGSNEPVDVWTPFQFDPANPGNRGGHFLSVIGRLKPGVSVAQAMAEIEMLESGWKSTGRAQHLLNQQGHPVLLSSLHEDVVGAARPAVLMLLGAVGFVLLIACANVASLLLARAEARHREFAVRLALGAGRGRMLRQFLAEGVLLVFLGAVSGILLAQSRFGLRFWRRPQTACRVLVKFALMAGCWRLPQSACRCCRLCCLRSPLCCNCVSKIWRRGCTAQVSAPLVALAVSGYANRWLLLKLHWRLCWWLVLA